MQRQKQHTQNRSNTVSDAASQRSTTASSNNNNLVNNTANNSSSNNNNNINNNNNNNSNNNNNNNIPSTDNRGESQQQQHHSQQFQQQQPPQQTQLKVYEWVLGLQIRVKTLSDEEFEGQVYAYDPKTCCVVLQCPSTLNQTNPQNTSPKYDFRILKVGFLKDVIQLPGPKPLDSSVNTNGSSHNVNNTTVNGQNVTNNGSNPSVNNNNVSVFATTKPAIGYVQLDRIQAREMQNLKETQAAQARIGVGVTSEAQEIFDALSKTLPVRWSEKTIVVLEEVLIHPPYDIENCRAKPNSGAGSLARVKKVLEGEKKRLASTRKQSQPSSLQPYNL